ncbi:DUF6285 domain-containing protein [Mycobacterium sp. GA-2829]|uniref:DUF6285 domain-containing protein n=1 Tax=Mycobacterium sp. GA-2829 TaxID=1772283 RepID=UPI00073FC0AB|nr:DUF6285 domain-containing protein [Mycobacterium sp. GA-2829]KUI25344.1 hypothetical protein AU194_00120 [Mycobacterium sp. GA-2829]
MTGPQWLYGRPTAAELVAAVADFLDQEVRPALQSEGRPADGGSVSFHVRVAANVLRTVERELTQTTSDGAVAALDGLGFADETTLAEAIRAGGLDDRAAELLPALRAVVRHRLEVAHPGYDQTD